MPTFVFKDAEGNTYDVEAPVGTSEGKAFEKFQKALGSRRGGAVPNQSISDRAEAERMSGPERELTNIGAGASNVVNGALQWMGVKKPGNFGKIKIGDYELYQGIDYDPTDAGVNQRRARDDVIAQETAGGGALQVLGEAAPTLAVPAGGFVKGAQLGGKGLQAIWRAITGGGEQAAAKAVVPSMGRGLATASADSMIAGGVTGAAVSRTSDESRAMHAGGDAAISALAPGVMALAGKLVNMFRRGAADSRAAQDIIAQLGGPDEAAKVIEQVKQYNPNVYTADIPMTVGEITQNPAIAGITASTKGGQQAVPWANFKAKQVGARADALHDITQNADEVEALVKKRDDVTKPMRTSALEKAEEDLWFHAPTVRKMEELRKDPHVKANKSARAFLDEVQEQLESGISPQQLYEYRKIMLEKYHGKIKAGDSQGVYIKGAGRTVLDIRDAMDEGLDQATKGRWSRYLEEYKGQSPKVNDAKASAKLREVFEGVDAPRISAGERGMVADVKGDKLGKAIEEYGPTKFGNNFSDRTLRGLHALRDNLSQTEGFEKLLARAKPGKAEGAGNVLIEAGEDAMVAPLSKTRRVISNFVNYASNLEKAALADAMRNPERFTSIVQKKLDQGKPLTATEDWILRGLRTLNVGAATALTDE